MIDESDPTDWGFPELEACLANDYNDGEYAGAFAAQPGDKPTWREALNGPDSAKWLAVREKEMKMNEGMGTYKLIYPVPRAEIVPSHYVCKIKQDEMGAEHKHKVRLVAGGDRQIYGKSYDETWAPVATIDTHRTFLAHATERGWVTRHVDFKSAYLNGKITENIYLRILEDWLKPEDKGKVGKMAKGLYGLKQAGRVWYLELKGTMMEKLGFSVMKKDPTAFIKHDRQRDEHIAIAVNVDDMDLIASSDVVADRFIKAIGECYPIKDLGETHYLLGFEVKRDKIARTISLNQGAYIDTIAKRFALDLAKPIYTPMETGAVLHKDQCPRTPHEYEHM